LKDKLVRMKSSDTILVPVDFSDVAGYAMDHASAIARMFNYRIVLLHVAEKLEKGSKEESEVEQAFFDIASWLAHSHGVKVNYMIRTGNILKVINAVADKMRVSFIVMGVHGKRGISKITQSYAYKMVCRASAPVVVVKDKHHHLGYRNIVIPIDFSRKSTQKIAQAVKFANFFDAQVRVFGFLSSDNKAKIINKEALLKSVTDVFEENNVKVTTDLVVDPGMDWPEALIEFAEKVKAELIMIVAERGGRIQEIFAPNYTEKILDKVDVPVLTIAPRDEDLAAESKYDREWIVTPFVDPLGLIVNPKQKKD